MTTDEIIVLGTKLGLFFNLKTNYEHALIIGRVVFDGINGQRFMVEGKWSDDEIYKEIGKSLILMGERKKKMEIKRALDITGD